MAPVPVKIQRKPFAEAAKVKLLLARDELCENSRFLFGNFCIAIGIAMPHGRIERGILAVLLGAVMVENHRNVEGFRPGVGGSLPADDGVD